MFLNILKLFVVVILPLGLVSAAFGIWFDRWLIKKYPNMSSKTQGRVGTVGMLSVAAILVIGFFIVMHMFFM
jgi:hypothetical protein